MAANRESMPFPMSLHQQLNQAPPQQHNQAPPQQHNQAPPQQQHNQLPPPQHNQLPPPQQSQNMQLSFAGGADGTAVYKPTSSSLSPPPGYQHHSAGAGNPALNMNVPVSMTGSEPVKKRRGRPRKYGPESGMSLGLIPGASSFSVGQPSGSGVSGVSGVSGGSGGGTPATVKKMRGRAAGSSQRDKLDALGSTGVGFTPHVMTVRAGEDIASKIMGFSQNGPRTVCVLSANGAVSNVTLRQSATSGGTVTYEGRFEILSLTGSFLLLENNGHKSRMGGLSVTLSAPDGNVLGGCVSGLLIAASPVQIVVGSFIPDGQKEEKQDGGQVERSSLTIPRVASTQVVNTPSSPQARGTMSEPSGGGHESTGGPYNNTNLSMPWK
ncbi:hypothetical protein EUTSA_v10016801mg [Eutrema salsugineum]|uniref:AT-hook motif nuclear-localized protein n=2 Tax=Eutrema salsugineum TaxID=72664 RepID=V4M6P1_EUTSA|nr:AT-hook motif nuclear-localized protein 10 isoform X2 [Eutrema salsugineum]XP_024003851.1 AT-hook motif nuclear-localized protein 10 isoform X2 [Eutrema salsugineum]ESQ51959.1 hypothetical protein EUTSA_v10016801mg [Eutrema salsugineum]